MLHRVRWFIIAFSSVLALAPFAGIVAAALLALGLGCEINDAAQEPCVAGGADFGPLLSELRLTASLGAMTFLILAGVLSIWGTSEGIAFLARRWRRDRQIR